MTDNYFANSAETALVELAEMALKVDRAKALRLILAMERGDFLPVEVTRRMWRVVANQAIPSE